MTAADGIFLLDVLPGIFLKLLETEAHLALLAVESEDNSLYFVAGFQEVVGAAEVLAPAHLAYVDKTLYAGLYLYERTVVCHNDNFAVNMVADLEVGIKIIPGMGHELLETEGDTLLLVVEVDDNDLDVLVELDNLAGIGNTAPAEVGDVNETVNTAEVDEYSIRSDVLDLAFEHLALLELGDDLLLLLLELCLDESFVADNNILIFLVDLDNLEFHGLVNKYVVVADRTYVDLAAGEERLDAEDIDDHTALGAALDITLDDFVVLKSFIDAIPAAGLAGFLVGKTELAVLVLERFDEYLHLVADFQVGIVAEFAYGDDGV